MSQVDPSVYRRRRLFALVAVLAIFGLFWGASQLLASGQAAPEPEPTAIATTEETPAEVTNCQPGVVQVEAFIGSSSYEPYDNVPQDQEAFLWYEIVNTGLVDCVFDVGTYATFFTISSGDQVYFSSRDCDRSQDSQQPQILKANVPIQSTPGEWLKVFSSSEDQCGPENELAPRGGAAYDLKVEVSGVVSEKKRFYLY